MEVIYKEDSIDTDFNSKYISYIDNVLRLFGNDISLTELMRMDLPSTRAFIDARQRNLTKSMENYRDGKIDYYSSQYLVGGFGGGISSSKDSSSQITYKREKRSNNLRAIKNEKNDNN